MAEPISAPGELPEHVAGCVFAAHALREPYAECDGRVDVAARDAADAVGHCHDRQAECESYGQYLGRCVAAQEYGASAAHQYENHCPQHFCKIFLHSR